MAAELLTGLSLFKSLYDSAKALKDINDAAVRNTAIVELTEKILAAREAQTTLAERVSELEAEVAGFKTWEAEKQRYKLAQFVPGAVAYLLKRSEARGEPGHALCPNCYQRGIKSILQSNGERMVVKHGYACPSCKAAISTGGDEPPAFAD